jgi:hypothetical protein
VGAADVATKKGKSRLVFSAANRGRENKLSIVVLGPQASPPARVETNQFSYINASSAVSK